MKTVITYYSQHHGNTKKLLKEKECKLLGEYLCLGFDTFGPFKLVGGVAKGHPDEDEIRGAVEFYNNL